MGTAGMRASLVSREVIADSIELVARGHLFDGLVCLVGCDKTIPAARDGARAARHPGARLLRRLDRAGPLPRRRRDDPGRLRGGRRARRRARSPTREVHALESVACPGAGACGGQFTANTMATALDFLGVSAPGLNEIPADASRQAAGGRRARASSR